MPTPSAIRSPAPLPSTLDLDPMLHRIHTPGQGAYLASHRPIAPSFSPQSRMIRSLVPVWNALTSGDPDEAFRLAMTGLKECKPTATSEMAGLLVGLAGAEFASGRLDQALRSARRSLKLIPAQWTARRLVACIRCRRQEYEEAYSELSDLPIDLNGPSWDEKITVRDVELGLASCAWNIGQWKAVIRHLDQAFPDGIATMPEAIQEDMFRVRMYLNRPVQAAAAAALLIPGWTPERSDDLLQTLVQRKFTSHALPLYRTVFAKHPESELIRRRLVGLCIREGAVEEARRLVAPAALRTAA